MPKRNVILLVVFIVAVAGGTVILLRNNPYARNLKIQKNSDAAAGPVEVTIDFWGLWDSSDAWQPIIDKFEKETHNWNGQDVKVKINYTKKDIASYEEEIKKSYDENKSPGIFMINNYWTGRYADRLEPLTGNAAYLEEYGLLDYEKLQEIFPTYVLKDALDKNNQMLAVPIYSDSLALYYNKDLFQKAGIANPPSTWEELKADVKKLTLLGKKNEIKQSGIALGGGKNVNRACDILAALMMQGGGKVVDADGGIDFNKKIGIKTSQGTQEREPGLTAIQFYMEFSDPVKEIYTWNGGFADSVQDFANGKTAMMINYDYQRANLLALKPELNYGIAPLPQLPDSTPVNISNVWMPAVSSQKSCVAEGKGAESVDCGKIAWSFLSFAAQKENIADYLQTTGKASARIDLIGEQSQKGDAVSVFANQAAMARSYNKFDDRIEGIFAGMLDEISADRGNWKAKTDNAAAKIEELKK